MSAAFNDAIAELAYYARNDRTASWITKAGADAVVKELERLRGDLLREGRLADDRGAESEWLRSLLIEAESFITYVYDIAWERAEELDVRGLLLRLREAEKSLRPVVLCRERFETPDYVSLCELPRGHVGAHALAAVPEERG